MRISHWDCSKLNRFSSWLCLFKHLHCHNPRTTSFLIIKKDPSRIYIYIYIVVGYLPLFNLEESCIQLSPPCNFITDTPRIVRGDHNNVANGWISIDVVKLCALHKIWFSVQQCIKYFLNFQKPAFPLIFPLIYIYITVSHTISSYKELL